VSDFDCATRLKTGDAWIAHRLGLALLGKGDQEAYREQCRQMVRRFGGTPDAGTAEAVASLAVLLPAEQGGPDRETIVGLARLAAEKGPEVAGRRETFGAALARAGRLQEAAIQLHKAIELHGKGGSVGTQLFLALAEKDQAKTWLDRAGQYQEATTTTGGQDRLRWRLLREEVQALLQTPKR
jgi:hypothetical protein